MTPSNWTGPDGAWPLPWLQPVWEQAIAQRGHALLLHGPDGVGQFELALALAQTWLCESQERGEAVYEPRQPSQPLKPRKPCGRCEGCHQLQAGVHPDLMILTPEALRERLGLLAPAGEEGGETGATSAGGGKGKSAGREIKVADVRRAIDWGHQTSGRGLGKVLVIYPAQSLNRVAANALLKTLEEPAGRLRLVLSTGDPQALLPTLRSRCQQVALPLPGVDVATQWLEGQGVAHATILLKAAGGRPQDALAMAQDGLDARLWPELPGLIRNGQVEGLAGLPVPRAIDALQKLCLDLLSRAHGAPALYFPDEALPSGAQASALSSWWQELLRAARHADHPWNAGLLLESLVLQGRQCWPARDTTGSGRSAARRR